MVLAGRWGYFKGTTTAPVPQDLSNPTNAETLEAQRWERKDEIMQCLLGQHLPNEISMDMDIYLTVKEQWDALVLLTTPKTMHARANMHQSFLDMRYLKGSDVREFLTSLKKWRHELTAAGITVTEPEYKHTIIHGLPDPLPAYASQTMGSLHLTCKLTCKPFDMTDVIDMLCKEADCLKTVKDLAQGQGKGKGKNRSSPPASDDALAATGPYKGSDSRHCKGKCHHCQKEGHWAHNCRTRKWEEAMAAADQNMQATQSNLGTTSKPENKPVGSANHIYLDDSDNNGFYMAEEDVVHAYPDYAEPDPLMGELEDNDDDEWEAFRAETWGAGDDDDLDWAGLNDRLVKEGEEWDVKEEAGAVTTPLEDSAPRTKSKPAPHIALHVHAITSMLVPLGAPDIEGCTPHIGDGRLRTTSSSGEQVMDTMRHAHHPQDVADSPEFAHPNDPKLAICAREGQSHGFDADMQADQAPWLGPGTVTKEQDVPLASAAQLKGEEMRKPTAGSKQIAAPGTPSIFNAPKSPATPSMATPPAPKHTEGPDSPPVRVPRTARVHEPSRFVHKSNAQPGGVAHPGSYDPHLAPGPQRPGTFPEDPGEPGGVPTVESGAPAPHADPDDKESAFAAKTADAGHTLDAGTFAEAKRSPGWPPCKATAEESVTCRARPAVQQLNHTGSIHIDAAFPLTDPAPASAAENRIPHDVPLCEAVVTPTWAVLAARPDATLFDANGSKAVDRRASSGHAFPINDSATCWPSRRLEDVPSTTKCDYIAAMHGSKEAPQPCSPVPDTFGGFNTLTPSFSDHPAPLAFTRDRQDHPPDRAYHHAAQLDHTGLQPEDDTVAAAPSNPQTSAMEKHFVASHGLHAK